MSYDILSRMENCLIHRFLVGEGAREWAKSKGIAVPATPKEADEVVVFQFLS